MSEALLTPEELQALREQSGGLPEAPRPLDLAGNDRGLRRAANTLGAGLEDFGRLLRERFTRQFRVPCAGEGSPLEVLGPLAMEERLGISPMLVLVRGNRDEELAVLGVSASLAWALIERAFGGGSNASDPTPTPTRKKLTTIEQASLAPHLLDMAGLLESALRRAPERTWRTEVMRAGGADLALPSSVLFFRASIQSTVLSGDVIAFLLPACNDATGASAPIDGAVAATLSNSLRHANLEMTARLGNVVLSVTDLLALRPGDLVRLDTDQHDLVTVAIGGESKFLGKPVQHHGGLGIELKEEVQ